MTKFSTVLATMIFASIGVSANAQTFMDPANILQAPSGSVGGDLLPIKLSWNSQAIMTNNYNGLVTWGSGESMEIPTAEFEILNGNTLNIFVGALGLATGNTYTVTIGEGCVKNAAGDINPEQVVATFYYEELNSDIYSQKAVFTNPENGIINISWPGISYVEDEDFDGDYDGVYLTDDKGETYPLTSQVSQSEDYDFLIVDVNNMGLATGSYTLILQAGSIYLEDDDWMGYVNAADSYTFSYTGTAASTYMGEATVTQAPEGVISGELAPIKLTWNQAIIANNFNGTVTWGSQSQVIPVEEFEILNGNTLNIFVGALGLATGNTYTITIGEGCVKNAAGDINPEQVVATFTYVMEDTNVYSQDAMFEVIENGVISVSWPGISYVEADYPEDIYLTNAAGNVYPLSSSQISSSNYYDALIVNVTSLDLGSGYYTLIIPEGSIYLEDDDYQDYTNADESYEFYYDNLSGVSAINDTNADHIIYNLQGIKVGNAGDIKNLNNGIYIINGQKISVKK